MNEAVVVEPTTLRGIQGLKIDEFHLWSQSGGGYRKRHGRHRLRNTGNLDCFLSIPPSNILIAVQNGNLREMHFTPLGFRNPELVS